MASRLAGARLLVQRARLVRVRVKVRVRVRVSARAARASKPAESSGCSRSSKQSGSRKIGLAATAGTTSVAPRSARAATLTPLVPHSAASRSARLQPIECASTRLRRLEVSLAPYRRATATRSWYSSSKA